MVSKWQSSIVKLDTKRKFNRKSKLVDISNEMIAKYEAESEPKVQDTEEAFNFLARKGLNVTEMTRSDLILESCVMGYINVVKSLITPQYGYNLANGFGEGPLHYAAKGDQK